jgi:hypothetical protein
MTSITHGSIAEYEERKALKEHIAGLIVENKKLCEQIDVLRELVNQCFERPLLSCGPLIEQMAEELKWKP